MKNFFVFLPIISAAMTFGYTALPGFVDDFKKWRNAPPAYMSPLAKTLIRKLETDTWKSDGRIWIRCEQVAVAATDNLGETAYEIDGKRCENWFTEAERKYLAPRIAERVQRTHQADALAASVRLDSPRRMRFGQMQVVNAANANEVIARWQENRISEAHSNWTPLTAKSLPVHKAQIEQAFANSLRFGSENNSPDCLRGIITGDE